MARETDDFSFPLLHNAKDLEDLKVKLITFQEYIAALVRSVYIAENIEMGIIGDPTFTNVQQMQDIFHSSGFVSGNGIVDAGSGDITVDGGTGLLRTVNDNLAQLKFADYLALGATAIPLGTVRYAGVQYNSSSEIAEIIIKTTDSWNFNTDFPLGSVVNDAGKLHISNRKHAVGDHANFMIQRAYETQKYARDNITGGLILGETGTRNVTISEGGVWIKLEKILIAALDTSGADTFDSYYSDGGSGFTKISGVSQWDNLNYDDGSGTLAVMGTNRHGILWFYLEPDGELVCLYGTSNTSLQATAEAEIAPTSVPLRVSEHAFLVGRIVYKKADAVALDVQSIFTQIFN